MVGLLGVGHLRTVPVGLVVLPVREPVLFRLQIHRSEVEGTVVGDEGLEALLVDTCQIIDAEAAKRGTDGCQTVLVDERQILGSIVNSRQIVLHTLACPVAADFFLPFLSEAGQSVAVGGYDHIAVGGHNLEVPAIAPELAHRTLWTTLAEQQRGIFLAFLVVGRQHHPYQLLLSVGGLHPALLHLAECQLVKDVLVLKRDLGNGSGRTASRLFLGAGGGYHIDVRRGTETLAGGQNLLSVVGHLQTRPVGPVFRQLGHLTLLAGTVHIAAAVPDAQEVELRIRSLHLLAVDGCPTEGIDIALPVDIALGTCS